MLVDGGQQSQIVAGGVVWGVAGWLPWPRSMVWTAPRDILTAAATSEEIEGRDGGEVGAIRSERLPGLPASGGLTGGHTTGCRCNA